MPTSMARRRAPHAAYLAPRFSAYQRASAAVMALVYFGLLRLIRLPELDELLSPVLRRVQPLVARLTRR